jgi:hypothetical protein
MHERRGMIAPAAGAVSRAIARRGNSSLELST